MSCDFQGLTVAARLLPISKMKCHVPMPGSCTNVIQEQCPHQVGSAWPVLLCEPNESVSLHLGMCPCTDLHCHSKTGLSIPMYASSLRADLTLQLFCQKEGKCCLPMSLPISSAGARRGFEDPLEIFVTTLWKPKPSEAGTIFPAQKQFRCSHPFPITYFTRLCCEMSWIKALFSSRALGRSVLKRESVCDPVNSHVGTAEG